MNKQRILIVDDNKHILDMLERVIERFYPDFQTVVASSGPAALDQMRRLEKVQSFDLILTDYQMPGMDGLDLARVVRKTWPNIRIVLMTACADSATLQDMIKTLSLDGYLRKPFNIEELREVLQT